MPFGDQSLHEAHGLGVRNMAKWHARPNAPCEEDACTLSEGMVQYYSCPVKCAGDHEQWRPCGASSTVAIAATIANKSVVLKHHDVYVDGVSVGPIAEHSSYTSSDGTLTVSLLAHTADDNDVRADGPTLRFSFQGPNGLVNLDTWFYLSPRMPTGYLHNARLTLPDTKIMTADFLRDGVCFAENDVTIGHAENVPMTIWPPNVLKTLQSECKSFEGQYLAVKDSRELCLQTGLDMQRGHMSCAKYAIPARYQSCLTDFCALNMTRLTPTPAVKQDETARPKLDGLPQMAAAQMLIVRSGIPYTSQEVARISEGTTVSVITKRLMPDKSFRLLVAINDGHVGVTFVNGVRSAEERPLDGIRGWVTMGPIGESDKFLTEVKPILSGKPAAPKPAVPAEPLYMFKGLTSALKEGR